MTAVAMRPTICIGLILAALLILASPAAISPRSKGLEPTSNSAERLDGTPIAETPSSEAISPGSSGPSGGDSTSARDGVKQTLGAGEQIEEEARSSPHVQSSSLYGPVQSGSPTQGMGFPPAFGFGGSAFHQPSSKLDQVQVSLDCLKTKMDVHLLFPEPFMGIIYPFNNIQRCVLHVGKGETEVHLSLGPEPCGPSQLATFPGVAQQYNPHMEHRIMIQWDLDLVQEYDSSILVRCDRPADYNRTVKFDMNTVAGESQKLATGTHTGPKLWMEIQSGEGPTSPPLMGPVFLGQTLSLVFSLADDYFDFDSNVLSCWASDGSVTPPLIPYVDPSMPVSPRPLLTQLPIIENSCSVKPKLFGNFQKLRMPLGSKKTTTQWVLFKAFRFPTTSRLLVSCDIQVCFQQCPQLPPCNLPFDPRSKPAGRTRRSADGNSNTSEMLTMVRNIEVLMTKDEDGSPVALTNMTVESMSEMIPASQCLSPTTFYGVIIGLGIALLIMIACVAVYVQRQVKHRSSK